MKIKRAVFLALFAAGMTSFTDNGVSKRDLEKDLNALNLGQADIAGGKLTPDQERDFLKAEKIIRNSKKFAEALGILQSINVNSGENPDDGYAAVNLSISRAYFFQGRCRLSLKHAHRAVQFCPNRSSLWSKALFMLGAAYMKLDENDKAVLMFRMAAENKEKNPGIAGLALIYLENLRRNE